MKGIFVILDGVADDTCSQLNGKTPLEYAKTPNLDFFASSGEIDYCFPIAKGVAPQSSSGLVSLFGADFRGYPRGPLEAVGAGVSLNDGDLIFRCNFSTIESLSSLKLIDRRVGRTLTTGEARELADAVNSKVKLPFKFELIPTIGHRAVLVFRGVFSDKISNVDPSYEQGLSVEGEN
ncbi:MAG: phosphoglycerate mutase, partial [Nanoarchaeota archaeon]